MNRLSEHRNRRSVVVACVDQPLPDDWAQSLQSHAAALVVEDKAGPVSERVGRPMIVVCDEYLEVSWTAPVATLADVTRALEEIALCAGRCPGAGEESGTSWHSA